MKLRDKFWLWGHPEGRYNNEWGNNQVSRMTPMEACIYLGLKNTYMVPVGVDVNMRQYNKSFQTLNEVGWECCKACTEPTAIDPIINEAADFPNVKRIVFDDFMVYRSRNSYEIDNLKIVRERMKNNEVRPMEMWMVIYNQDLNHTPEEDEAHIKSLEAFDGAIMWTWKECDVPLISERWELFKKMTDSKKRQIGIYLWNFGERKEATGSAVKWQLDWARERLLAGDIEGIVLHTNTMADLDLEAYDVAIEWMGEHGDEET